MEIITRFSGRYVLCPARRATAMQEPAVNHHMTREPGARHQAAAPSGAGRAGFHLVAIDGFEHRHQIAVDLYRAAAIAFAEIQVGMDYQFEQRRTICDL